MPFKRESLLDELEAGVLDDRVSLSAILRKCVVLGGRAGSEKLRDWASLELNGYSGDQDLPEYRRIPAPLFIKVTNFAGYNPIEQQLHGTQIPEPIRDEVDDWECALIFSGVGEVEALVDRNEKSVHLSPSWAGSLVSMLNNVNQTGNSRAAAVYWTVSTAALKGSLSRVRATLATLVAELRASTPDGQALPDKAAADGAVQLIVTGDRNTVTFATQQTEGGGSNTVSIGAGEPDAPKRGWQRWKKPGTVIVGLATIGGTAVGVLTWLDWTPW
ncbi:hypothetical protein [Amycolatopsis sp. lyj-84]|uniref:AbiTii domain-containing protein n=1 Tax=Amycolatopsis sp. lyj-84 TaxID=2789284 RepID=UPI00397CDC45